MGTVAYNIPIEAGQIPQNALAAAATAQNTANAQQENRLRAAMAPTQLAAAQQNLQAGALGLQQQKIQMEQQQAINKAYHDSFAVDPESGRPAFDTEAMTRALALSGHGAAIPGVLEAQTKWQQTATTLAETKNKLKQQMVDFQGDTGRALQAAQYDPNQAIALLTQSVRHGIVDEGTAQPMIQQIQAAQQQDPSGNAAKAIIKPIADQWVGQSAAASKIANEAKTAEGGLLRGQAATAAEQRKATDDLVQRTISGLAANAPKSADDYAAEVYGLSDPEARKRLLAVVPVSQYDPAKSPAILQTAGMTPEQQVQATKAAADAARAAKPKPGVDVPLPPAVESQRVRIARESRPVVNAVQPGANGAPSPAAQQAVDGRMDPGTLRALLRRDPNFINQILAIDPKFDQARTQERYDVLHEFNSSSNSKAGGQVIALNTLVHHADLYLQAADALKNGAFRPGNAAYNAISNMMGAPAPNNAALIARFLAGETGKVATGGVPAEGEINGILANLKGDASNQQIQDAGKKILQIAAGRMTPLKEKAEHAGLGDRVQIIGPDAQAILTRYGFDPTTMKPIAQKQGGGGKIVVTAPDGNKYSFDNQAQVDIFKKSAGMK
jgi:hypothetical protein